MTSRRREWRSLRRGTTNVGQLLLIVLMIGTTAALAKRTIDRANDEQLANVADRTADVQDVEAPPTAEAALGAFKVRDREGAVVPLLAPGVSTVIMVSSRTCTWCMRTLKELGHMAAGRPLSHLTLLTLEGANDGAPMLAREGLAGARLIGPVGSTDQVLMTFRFAGTPTFLAVDRAGKVVKTLPGYPTADDLRRLFTVMVGDAETP